MTTLTRGLYTTGIVLTILSIMASIPLQLQGEELTVKTIYREIDTDDALPEDMTWLPESDRYSYIRSVDEGKRSRLILENAESGRTTTIVSAENLRYPVNSEDTLQISLESYQWFPDEQSLLFTDYGDVWRYQMNEEVLTRLTDTESKEEEVQISPDGRFVSYVREYDLYALEVKSGEEIRLTTTGNDSLFNGKLDWVYQEELVGRGIFKGYWWSPDSRHIAYLQFDESPVPEYPLVDWMSVHPELELMHYPKAGDDNPMVRLGTLPIQSQPQTTWIDTVEEREGYLPRVYWLPGGRRIAHMWLDRFQQHLKFYITDIQSGETELVLEEKDSTWINIEDQVHFFRSGDQFLWGSERNGYRHLYLYNTDGTSVRQLTDGQWVVDDLVGIDEEREYVYFTGTRTAVLERQLYRVRTDGGDIIRVSRRTGTHDPALSESGKYYYDEYSDEITPEKISLHAADGELVRYIEENERTSLDKYNLQIPEFFTFSDDSGHRFHASLLKPANFDSTRKYPVLIYVYGGPHVQVVRREFGGKRHLWHQMLAQRGYLVFSMDGRGSYGRGHHWEEEIYRQMGKLELRDQLKGVEYLKSLPYVDSGRIGIWGWSYGGYMTLYALTHSKEFVMGISVAPVTDWDFYDTIYTERYMSLPDLNPAGYRKSAPVNFAGDLSGELLLVHGTGDDNVHMQNTIQMTDALIDAGKDFDLMLYPQQQHGISPTNDRIHLYEKMTEFVEHHLGNVE